MRSRLGLAGASAVLVFALAACGGTNDNGIPTANGGTATPRPSGTLSDEEKQSQALKFTQCMRDHGIELEDPEDGKAAAIGPGRSGADDEKTKAALEACRQYMPSGGDRPEPDPQVVEGLRQLAQCMREHGIANFPDPDADGSLNIGGLGIDPNDSAFKAADEACKDLRPSPGAGGGGQGGGQ